MKSAALSALAGILLILGFVPVSHAVEILRWGVCRCRCRLVVGEERVVFIDRNVRVSVPASVVGATCACRVQGCDLPAGKQADSARSCNTGC